MAPKRRGGQLGSTSLRLDGCSPVLEDSGGTFVRVTRSASSRRPSKWRVPAVTSIDESDEDGDGKHIKMRWSTARVSKFVKTLTPRQKKFIVDNQFGFVLDIKSFRVPIGFIEWVMSNTHAASNEFIIKHKCICFTKDMVVKVLGVPSGTTQVEVDSSDFEVEALVEQYKSEYKVDKSYPISKCMELMKDEEDEQTFMRHFMLFLISTILMPGKSNTLCVEYLYSLLNLESLINYDWAEEILHVIMHEVRRFHTLRDCLGRAVAMKHFYMEGCLPFLAIVYADFLDLPQGSAHVHELNYNVPRICHLSSTDFDFVMEIDRNNRARPHCYGMRPFRDISTTPYRTIEPVVQGNSRIYLHADVQRLADKHKLLVKDDIGILVKSLTEICDNRISSFAADFNTLYMSKIAEADRPGPSAANVQAARVSDVSPAPSTSNAHFNSGISGRYNVTPAASVSRSGNFYEPNYDQDVGNSSVPSHSACVEPQSTAPTNVVHPICSLIALPTHANNVDDVPSPSISNVGNSDDCNGLGMFDDSINANINEISSQPHVASVPELNVSEGTVQTDFIAYESNEIIGASSDSLDIFLIDSSEHSINCFYFNYSCFPLYVILLYFL